jgi:hypothetical protein
VGGARSGIDFAFLPLRDDFPLAELGLRFEGVGMELRVDSGTLESGDGAGEGWLELGGWDDPKAAFLAAIALSIGCRLTRKLAQPLARPWNQDLMPKFADNKLVWQSMDGTQGLLLAVTHGPLRTKIPVSDSGYRI